jgi:DNA repair protein RecO (recombination protein O)
MSLYRDEAVVLRSWKLGEADRIVSLHTRGHGKVRGVAKGVRRTRSKFGARLEPTCHIAVQLYRGRGELDTITQVETINRFPSLRSDPGRFVRASALLEVTDQLAQDREPDVGRHVMLTRALATLDRQDSPLVVSGFFLKLLAHEGLQPELDLCVSCGASEPIEAIDFVEGGVLCRSCRRGRPVSEAALRLMRLMLGGGLGEALQEPASETTAEVESLATEAMESHLERRLRSITVLDRHDP